MFFNKSKYFVVLCKKIHGTPKVLKVIRVKSPTMKTCKTSNKEYIVDFSHPSYMHGLKTYCFIDVDDNCPMQLNSEPQISAEMLDALISDKTTRAMTDSLKLDSGFMLVAINLGIGAVLGVFAALTVMLILIQVGVF